MQSLIVFGEINKYLDTEIIEIESQFWNTDQEKNLIVQAKYQNFQKKTPECLRV